MIVNRLTWGLLTVGIAAPLSGLALGYAVGRIGCFINGDAWGAPNTACPFCGSVVYWHPHDLVPPDLIGVPTYPYPLYEIAAVAAVLALLWALRGHLQRPGTAFLLTTICYGIVRFGLSFVRQESVIVLGLQEAQVIAVLTSVLALAILMARMALTRQPARPGLGRA